MTKRGSEKNADMQNRLGILRRLLHDADGASFVELAILLPLLLLIIVPAIDLGRAFYASLEVAAAAHAGAIYGLENPYDTGGMASAAQSAASNLMGVSATASYGCECSDGTSASASCSAIPTTCGYNYVTYVDVVASAPYSTMLGYPGLPSPMTITRETRLRVGGN